MPDEIEFRTKPQIAVEMIDRALTNGVHVAAWTFDELYGRDGKFLDAFPTRRHCLIVARNVLTGEVKYFFANRVPGERNPITGEYITLRSLLRVAFGRWSIESCFRQAKEELGMDHYEVRGWKCIHRHFYVTQLSHLFCARIRQQYDNPSEDQPDRLSVEQVRSAMNTWLDTIDLPPAARRQRFENELRNQRYHQRRNRQARQSHTKTTLERLATLGINPAKIKSCVYDATKSKPMAFQ